MGGERETTAPQTKKTASGLEQCGTVRYHENAGEVHFHDDQNHLKVAIPSGVWYSLYQKLCAETPSQISFTDPVNGTALHASTFMKSKKKKKTTKVELEMYVEPVLVSSDLRALQRFTEGANA
jgi:hypothetical protein